MRIIILIAVVFINGCSQLGLAYNTNSVGHIEYSNKDGERECKFKLLQSALNAGDSEIESFSIKEHIIISSECSVDIDYLENETIED